MGNFTSTPENRNSKNEVEELKENIKINKNYIEQMKILNNKIIDEKSTLIIQRDELLKVNDELVERNKELLENIKVLDEEKNRYKTELTEVSDDYLITSNELSKVYDEKDQLLKEINILEEKDKKKVDEYKILKEDYDELKTKFEETEKKYNRMHEILKKVDSMIEF